MSNSSDTRAFFSVCFQQSNPKIIGVLGVAPLKKKGIRAMKKTILFIILFFVTGMVMAQDVIVKKDGSTILSKVEKVGVAEIEYKKWSNQDGPLYTISRTEVLSINYQSGEVDMFMVEEEETITYEIVKEGKMEREGRDLTLDGLVLTDNEVRRLVGEQNYQIYLSARKQINTGSVFGGILTLSLVTGIASLVAVCYGITDPTYTVVLAVSSIVTLTSLPFTCVFNGVGKGRMSRIADNYNKHGNTMSIQMSPSLMNSMNGNIGLGLTFTMNL